MWCSRFRIWHCHCSSSESCCGVVGLSPALGTSSCLGHSQKKKKKKSSHSSHYIVTPKKSSLVMRTFRIYSLSNFQVYSIAVLSFSHHIVYYIPLLIYFKTGSCTFFRFLVTITSYLLGRLQSHYHCIKISLIVFLILSGTSKNV